MEAQKSPLPSATIEPHRWNNDPDSESNPGSRIENPMSLPLWHYTTAAHASHDIVKASVEHLYLENMGVIVEKLHISRISSMLSYKYLRDLNRHLEFAGFACIAQ